MKRLVFAAAFFLAACGSASTTPIDTSEHAYSATGSMRAVVGSATIYIDTTGYQLDQTLQAARNYGLVVSEAAIPVGAHLVCTREFYTVWSNSDRGNLLATEYCQSVK